MSYCYSIFLNPVPPRIGGLGGQLGLVCKYQNLMPSPQPLSQIWERGKKYKEKLISKSF
jgi:hypothetical protein